MIRKLACLAAFIALSACATAEGYQQHMDLLVGMTSDQLQQQWGVPDRSPLTDGSELWVYHRTTENRSGGYWTTRERSRTEQYTDKDGNKQTRTVKISEPYYEPEVVTRAYCETRFTVGKDHLVKTVTFEGDGCVAEELKKKPDGAAQ